MSLNTAEHLLTCISVEVHTPRFLRDVSPFLTTALCYAAAGFDPQSLHLLGALEHHAMFLSNKIFAEGLKTLEIVQAYCLMVHWAPTALNWGDDRRWGWLGQAVRIATEIKLDKKPTESTTQFYSSVTPLPPNAYAALAEDRARSWTLLYVAEIALCVSTGRLGSIQGLNLAGGFRSRIPECEPHDAEYHLSAMEDLNRIYAKALSLSAGLRAEDAGDGASLRDSFNASWGYDMQEWAQMWPACSECQCTASSLEYR